MSCPHGLNLIRCTVCNGGPICIHGDLRELCNTCGYFEICEHNRRKVRCHVCRKSGLKQSPLYYKVCSVLEKVSRHALPHQLSKLIPKNERWNTIQEHIHSLSKGSRTVNSLP